MAFLCGKAEPCPVKDVVLTRPDFRKNENPAVSTSTTQSMSAAVTVAIGQLDDDIISSPRLASPNAVVLKDVETEVSAGEVEDSQSQLPVPIVDDLVRSTEFTSTADNAAFIAEVSIKYCAYCTCSCLLY